MAELLKAGYNVVINHKNGATNTPIYPFTRTGNVKDAQGRTLDEIISTLATKDYGNYVPDFSGETVSNIRFLRNDNTWATIRSASTTESGIVQLSDAVNIDDSTVAATAKAVKTVNDAVTAVTEDVAANYVKLSQLGAATAEGVTGVATLDANGFIPTSQLPSYVDEIIECTVAEDKASATTTTGEAITPEASKIYVDINNNKTYRWSGSTFVEISESLALGETEATAFDGARGKVAYDHSQALHARVDATLTEASETNGYIKINGAETLVYTHPMVEGGTETNPHGTTAADVGLGKVENKTSEEIRAEITSENVTTALGYTPQNSAVLATAANNGVMSSAYAAKLDNCMETSVGSSEPTFTGSGIWYEVVSQDA